MFFGVKYLTTVELACFSAVYAIFVEVVAHRALRLDDVPEVLSETAYDALPEQARERIGMAPGQKNVLVRVVIRDLVRTLTSAEANALRDAVYASLHEGSAWQWASAAA